MPRTGQLYIFGDSLSDDGATGVQVSEEPIDRFYFGRASNGLLWHENIRNDLAVAPAATSISQAPNEQGFLSGSDQNGINFAHGGAISGIDSNPARPGAIQQAEGFAALVASGDIPAPDDQDVFVIWIGGNDFLDLESASLLELLQIGSLDDNILENIETTVDTLVATGAQNFLIPGLPTAGGAFLGDIAPAGGLLARLWNTLSGEFNDKLEDYVDDLNATEGFEALFVDIASFVEDVEDDPASFGFSNVTSDIFTDDAPLDDQTYFSVDGIHPTGAGHVAIAAFVVETAEAAGFDLTALAGNVLPGSARNDTLTGTDGDDTITGEAGDDLLNGRGGADIAVYSGTSNQYVLSLGSDVTLTDRSGTDGTDTLIDIDSLDFGGTPLALDKYIGAASLSSDAFRDLVEIYLSYFDRAPDALGLTFWANAFASGLSLLEITEFIAASEEAIDLFPGAAPDRGFVESIYLNTLGREADEAGAIFWTDALVGGAVSKAQFVRELLNGARAPAPEGATADFIAQQAADQAYLDAKVDIGVYYSAILGLSNVDNAISVMAIFDGTPESRLAAKAAADEDRAEATSDAGIGEFIVELLGVVDDPFLI